LIPNQSNRSVADIVTDRQLQPAPRATYRLQFNHQFTFDDAAQIVPYLADLGISHVYASPLFAAAPGSMHGYDVVDYSRINPEIGSDEDFDRFVETLHRHDLKLIVDFVPNHMGIEAGKNAWWQDVLEHGEWSPYADYFDIDWTPLKRELMGKVLVPFLGGQYGDVLEAGELKLAFRDDSLVVDYWDTPFPISPRTWPLVLNEVVAALASNLDPEDIDLLELESIVNACNSLDESFAERSPEQIEARRREALVIKHRLTVLVEHSAAVAGALNDVIRTYNGVAGQPESFDALDRLLGRQSYRLAFWRVASEEINYRRFFAINSLAAIRQEEPAVFAAAHDLLLRLCAAGKIDGVRIDHPDGLWDPAGYFRQLQHACLRSLAGDEIDDSAIDAELDRIAANDGPWPLYVVAEKILEHGESLPEDWPIAGTVGYEFAQAATGVFVDPAARQLFDRIFSRFTGDKIRFPELVYEMKQRMMREAFASEINVLTSLLNRISEHDRHSRDFTLNSLRQVLREVIAGFAVYRTYTTCADADVAGTDRRFIESAIAAARRRNPVLDPSLFDFVNAVLQLHPSQQRPSRIDHRCHFAMKMQQLTGPVMAKALEDTAFYRFNRLASLNEVGGDPGKFGTSVEEFHRQNRARLKSWPNGLLASSTHDTKRSEDVRARISVLSEVPVEWRAAVNRWTRLNRKLKQLIDGALAPHRADEYVIYQTLIGTWPLEGLTTANRDDYRQRIGDYIVKVAREASRFTNWVNPDEPYEAALTGFVEGLLNQRRSRAFIRDFEAFIATVRDAGLSNSLSQQLLKLTSPGVPDIYQGTELWDDSLVDPDNRRPVDFAVRRALLDGRPDVVNGAIKLHLTRNLLLARRERPEVFARGDYVALSVSGPAADAVIAFARVLDGDVAVTVAARLVQRAGDVFGKTDFWSGTTIELPDSLTDVTFRDRLGQGETVRGLKLDELFIAAPVALLTSW
jgi:(1->4)-alpha-D-glucan 1-alpha-D-glucosylmutase